MLLSSRRGFIQTKLVGMTPRSSAIEVESSKFIHATSQATSRDNEGSNCSKGNYARMATSESVGSEPVQRQVDSFNPYASVPQRRSTP